jgi:hypothetical protein
MSKCYLGPDFFRQRPNFLVNLAENISTLPASTFAVDRGRPLKVVAA